MPGLLDDALGRLAAADGDDGAAGRGPQALEDAGRQEERRGAGLPRGQGADRRLPGLHQAEDPRLVAVPGEALAADVEPVASLCAQGREQVLARRASPPLRNGRYGRALRATPRRAARLPLRAGCYGRSLGGDGLTEAIPRLALLASHGGKRYSHLLGIRR